MAGGKETPRQKLIGLMYLVLLALLALQIGAEILVKFQQLNDSLSLFVSESQSKSSTILENIEKKVQERGNRSDEIKALNAAKELRKRSSELLAEIDKIKSELIVKTDGTPEEPYKNAKDTDKSSAYLIGTGDTKNGVAYPLAEKLNSYIEYLNNVNVTVAKLTNSATPAPYPKLAMSGKEDPMFNKREEFRTKDWAVLNFDHTPMIASLAFLTEKQSKIATYEGEILAKISTVVGAADFKFDKVFSMARAESKVVAAGTTYKAELFMTATSTAIQPTMTFNGSPIKVVDGKGIIEFKASGGAFNQDGILKKTWQGAIKIKKPNGQDTIIQHKEEYIVSKPVIQVQSASVSALYKNCGNMLNIQVPALGSVYDPSFRCDGADFIKGQKKGEIVVIPNAPSVKITVSSGGNQIGTEEFKVRLIPKPGIVAMSGGKEVNQKTGMRAPGPRSIEIKAVPDESFKNFLPKDARYRVTKWEAILVRGKRPVNKQSFTSPEGNLAAFAASAQPGDRILIEVLEVQRRNYQDKNENVPIPTTIMNVPLTD